MVAVVSTRRKSGGPYIWSGGIVPDILQIRSGNMLGCLGWILVIDGLTRNVKKARLSEPGFCGPSELRGGGIGGLRS